MCTLFVTNVRFKDTLPCLLGAFMLAGCQLSAPVSEYQSAKVTRPATLAGDRWRAVGFVFEQLEEGAESNTETSGEELGTIVWSTPESVVQNPSGRHLRGSGTFFDCVDGRGKFITAAHVVWSTFAESWPDGSSYVPSSPTYISTGRHLNDLEAPTYRVVEQWVHQLRSPLTMNDIAVLTTDRCPHVDDANNVPETFRYLALDGGAPGRDFVGMETVVVGFGNELADEEAPRHERLWKHASFFGDYESVLVTQDKLGASAECTGDSGGPHLINAPSRSARIDIAFDEDYAIAGIVAAGDIACRHYGIVEKVSFYRDSLYEKEAAMHPCSAFVGPSQPPPPPPTDDEDDPELAARRRAYRARQIAAEKADERGECRPDGQCNPVCLLADLDCTHVSPFCEKYLASFGAQSP